ncbi:minor capsid protein [Streptococcus dysgalactiae]|uniref:Minor capsid protein n=2 Tax=root TaxID=1 RepID=A0AAF0A1H0_STRDY|nr:minor capsid protein [Streptococcus dysgalactiae]YP_009191541.1 minor head protein [Streptococcus phage A25]APZ81879.1 minor capsid protein [Streptococcus phage Str01]QSJ04936.1 capsid protein [Streptococcus phage A1]HER4816122.1 minor capsid protein [Streptococcus pyogenes NGAS025]ALF02714.1 putative capsid protein [Streptococcus phage A25]MEC4578070.1 minor capsid protein [Streptococcus dysgalactiae]
MQNNKNFQEVLLDHINAIKDLPIKCRLDYFNDEGDDLVINAIPGGKIVKEYMDLTREVSLPFEIAVKSKNNRLASDIIWKINGDLSEFDLELLSTDDSYHFLSLEVDKPGINGQDEQGYFIYTLQVQALIEIEKGEEHG